MHVQTSGQAGSESIAQHDTELASRLAMAGAALLGTAHTSKASNVGGKPAPVKPPRDKGGTIAQPPADGAAASEGVPALPEGYPNSRLDPQPSLGAGATDHDRLMHIMNTLKQPPSPPQPTAPAAIGPPPAVPGVAQSAGATPTTATAAAAAAGRPPGSSSSQAPPSRKAVTQPWHQAPQLALPPGVSFSDPRNLYNRGQGFPIMGKAAPYQDPPPMYQQHLLAHHQSIASPAAGSKGHGAVPAGHSGKAPSTQSLSRDPAGAARPVSHPHVTPNVQQPQQRQYVPNGLQPPTHAVQHQQHWGANGLGQYSAQPAARHGAYPAAKKTSAPSHHARLKAAASSAPSGQHLQPHTGIRADDPPGSHAVLNSQFDGGSVRQINGPRASSQLSPDAAALQALSRVTQSTAPKHAEHSHQGALDAQQQQTVQHTSFHA